MTIIEAAIEDVKSALVEGVDLDRACREAEEDHGVKALTVKNRVLLAIGSVDKYLAAKAALSTVSEDTARKIALSETRVALQRLGAVKHSDTAGATKLLALVDQANRLGGNYRVATARRRG